MESMTGYAFSEKSTEQFSFSVEIKSLNSRYLETFVNVPRIMRNDENELLSFIKERISRGKVEVNIDIFDWQDTRPVNLNSKLIEKYYVELSKINKTLKISEPIKLESILGLEGVTNRERSSLSDKSRNDIFAALDLAVKKMIQMRKKEGMATKKDIANSLQVIAENASSIKKMSKNVLKEKKVNLEKRISALAGNPVDDTRLLSEIAILADKLDINEELVRLDDHLKKFRAVVKETDQIGKRLDFIAQEMFREINTIASKSSSSKIAHMAVEVKNHIDKIREQCRNIV